MRAGAFLMLLAAATLLAQDPLKKVDSESVSLFERISKTVVAIHCDVIRGKRKSSYVGSGVIISPDGEVLTVLSVVPIGAQNIRVTLHNGKTYTAKVLGYEERNTVCLLRLEGVKERLPFARLGSSCKVRPGSFVVAAANVYESLWREKQVAYSLGVVSAIYRLRHGDGDYWGRVIEFDAALNHGSDGGPLFNLRGEVVGLMVLGYSYSRWLGCAVPIDQIKFILEDLRNGCEIHPRYGLVIDEEEESFEEGVRLARVSRKGPAYRAGLRTGDRILKVDDVEIERPEQLANELTIVPPGSEVTFLVKRRGKLLTIKMKVQKWVVRKKKPAPKKEEVYIGFALREEEKGLFVDVVAKDSPAERAGVKKGDMILKANGKEVKKIEEFEELLQKMRPGQILKLLLLRDGKFAVKAEVVLGRKKR